MKKIILTSLLIFTFVTSNIFAQLTLPYTFENNSRYDDSEIYIGLVGKFEGTGDVWMNMHNSSLKKMSSNDNTVPGPVWSTPAEWLYPEIFTKLSDINNKTIQIPQGLFACRIFISFESPMFLHFHEGDNAGYAGANLNSNTDPNDGIRWELVELTWGDAGLWTNTSRVDAYQYPMGLEVNGFTGGITGPTYEESYSNATNGNGIPQFKRIGELIPHSEILATWDTNVSEPYIVAKTIKTHSLDGEPIIEQPSKVNEFPKDILDEYIDDIWNTYDKHDLNINIGDRGTWVGRINSDGIFEFTDPNDGSIARIYSKPTSVNAIEGSGSLAKTPNDPDLASQVEAYNEDLLIQAQIAAAISRHAIYTNITDDTIQFTHDATRFFQIEPFNEYVSFFHDERISFESQTYAFAYDDVGDHSSTIQSTFPTNVKVVIGGYGENTIEDITVNEEITTPTSTETIETTTSTPTTTEEITSTTSIETIDTTTPTLTTTEVIETILIPSSIEITNTSEEIITNTSIKFEAQAFDQDGNIIDSAVIWSMISGDATITATGIFTASTEGDYIVRATLRDYNDIYIDEIITVFENQNKEDCSGTANNGDYSYNVSSETSNPTITFIPSRTSIGNNTCILHYSTDQNIVFTSQNVIPDEAFQINANEADTVYFYYTYNLGENGEENNTADNSHSFQVGNCSSTIDLFNFSNPSNDFGNQFNLYPNPTNGRNPHLTGLNEDVTINIYTLEGKLISTDDTTNVETVKIKTLSLASGLYLVSIITKDEQFSKTYKLLVN